MGKRIGRKPKLTPQVQEKICSAIRAGNYAVVAAAYGGICKTTFYKWLDLGEKGREPYVAFADAIKKADADDETRSVAIIADAARTQWQAAAWHLERKHKERWARQERVEQSGTLRIEVVYGDSDPDNED